MFFSAELLARRDSGFGLLWLAATLGSKSTFKKLPKRSVLTADIAQLCNLIVEPSEPLALRLSSNLMVGVVRVYKVKQEIFLSDVTTCFNSLKKMVLELKSSGTADVQLQMAQPTVRSSALTLMADPRSALVMDFDDLVADWDEYLNIGVRSKPEEDDMDNNFDPKARKVKRRGDTKISPALEDIRADAHTLNEHHEHLLSASFELSINSGDPSQVEGNFDFNNSFFPAYDDLDMGGGIGDELAKELGEGWGGSPMKEGHIEMNIDQPLESFDDVNMGMDLGFDFGGDVPLMDEGRAQLHLDTNIVVDAPPTTLQTKKVATGSDKENQGLSSPKPPLLGSLFSTSPTTSFSRLLLSQDEEPQPLIDITANDQNRNNCGIKRAKRSRLLLDARTELTDEELKIARSQYMQDQQLLRREICDKKSEKYSGKLIEELVWGVPEGIRAQSLVDFWQENFKIHVEARSGALHPYTFDERPAKRRKTKAIPPNDEPSWTNPTAGVLDQNMDMDMGMGMDVGMDWRIGDDLYSGINVNPEPDRLRSSEDPEQARRVSRPPSVARSNLGFGLDIQDPLADSQRSSLFPWDNAGAMSSSEAPHPLREGSEKISVDHAEVRLRGSSLSRRESSLIPSQVGSAIHGRGFSPAAFGGNTQLIGEDYAFDVNTQNDSAILDSQHSDINLVTLERNSFNFLEYVRMQNHGSTANFTFDVVVPGTTSTRRVAASAFYHCLVLATKNLLRLKQEAAYGAVAITVV